MVLYRQIFIFNHLEVGEKERENQHEYWIKWIKHYCHIFCISSTYCYINTLQYTFLDLYITIVTNTDLFSVHTRLYNILSRSI